VANTTPKPIPGLRDLTDRLAPVFEVWVGTSRDAAEKETLHPPEPELAALARVLDSIDMRIGLRHLAGEKATGKDGKIDLSEQLFPLAGPWGDQRGQYTNDVSSVTFEESIEGNFPFSKVQIRLHNVYDAVKKTYRYTDIPDTKERAQYPIIDYGKTIVLRMGYPVGGSLREVQTVFEGMITTIECTFPADGEPWVDVTAVDRRDRLRAQRGKPRTFRPKSVENLIAEVAAIKGLRVGVSPRAEGVPGRTAVDGPVRKSADQDLLQFIVDRAKLAALEITAFGDTLFVLDPADAADPELEYVYREGLISFAPKLNGAGRHTQVQIVWHDTRKNERRVTTANTGDLKRKKLAPEEDTVLDRIRTDGKAGERTLVITSQGIASEQEAKQLALSTLKNQLDLAFTATGEALGDPLLRVRKVVRIRGTGRYDGNYYITMTRHRFGANGYQTSFNVRRNSALAKAAPRKEKEAAA
jgi:hypothetical protein